MPSPFPGMDPYLERSDVFPDLHDSMITYMREAIQGHLPGTYFAEIGRRVWVEMSRRTIGPDVNVRRAGERDEPSYETGTTAGTATLVRSEPVVVTVPHDERREPFLEIISSAEGERLVTVIEVLSPSNKTPGEQGRDLYLRKQREVLASQVHLVEIDLLRGGEHTTAVPLEFALERTGRFDYHVCIHRYDSFEDYLVYPIRLQERLPEIAIPLLPGDGTVPLDLQAVFNRCYEVGPYRHRVRYDRDTPEPPLSPKQAEWARGLSARQS